MEGTIVRPLFGEGTVETVSAVFDEIGLVLEALDGHVDFLTDENESLSVVRQGAQLGIAVERLRQLKTVGFHLTKHATQVPSNPRKEGDSDDAARDHDNR